MNVTYDVIVIGGGHAGTEAALAAARMGAETLLITHSIDTIGQMSCNPAIGGIGKGHLVKEIDALDGVMAKAADFAGIQFRTLNAKKGPAVQATRAQTCRVRYKQYIREQVETQPHLSIFQQAVDDLIVTGETVTGVRTQMGLSLYAKTVVLTVGTFLGGKIHIGNEVSQGGRAGDPPSNALATRLRAMPFRVGRLKTGTPPRIDGKTVDFSLMDIQPGDEPRPVFSFMGDASMHPTQLPCHITYTNERTHDIIRQSLHLSAMYSGNIEGVGPRYCPSIEDKIVRFADKTAHQVFVEPEGLHTQELYPNGLSTSLPFEVQLAYIRSMKGFECAHITRAGYAIEYDFFDPRDLFPTLETKYIHNLFFAGQINGTTGYEEAAAQGLVAGMNAARHAANKPGHVFERSEAYIGVLIDDLITNGTLEPYRMFTSRAEHRLLLREDNADRRLTALGHDLGVVSAARMTHLVEKEQEISALSNWLHQQVIQPGSDVARTLHATMGVHIENATHLTQLLKRPEVSLVKLLDAYPIIHNFSTASQFAAQTDVKYAGYIARAQEALKRHARFAAKAIPEDFDYTGIQGLSAEMQEKFTQVRPSTVDMASRIPGVTPAAISLLLIHLKKYTAQLHQG